MGSRTRSGRPSALDNLVSAGAFGRKSATAAAMTTTSAAARLIEHGRFHLRRRLDPRRPRRPAAAPAAGRGDEDHLGAPRGGRLGQGVALLARGPVGDEADGVDGLPGAPRAHHHAATVEVVAAAGAEPSTASAAAHDVDRLGQAPGSDVAPGQPALLRGHHVHAPAAQGGQVVLHGGVLPHLGVHGRAHHHRGPGGEHGGGEQPVGDAGRVAAEEAGRGRHDQDQIGALAQLGVGDGVGLGPQAPLAPAPRPAPRTSPRPRSGWRHRSGRGRRGRRRRRGGGTPRPLCRRRCRRSHPRTTGPARRRGRSRATGPGISALAWRREAVSPATAPASVGRSARQLSAAASARRPRPRTSASSPVGRCAGRLVAATRLGPLPRPLQGSIRW